MNNSYRSLCGFSKLSIAFVSNNARHKLTVLVAFRSQTTKLVYEIMSGKSLFCSDVPDVVIKSNFEKYDKDGSNVLEKNEMLAMLSDLGLDEKQAEVCFMMIDKDGSTSVSKHEFMEWFKSGEGVKFVDDQDRYAFVRRVADAFKFYDRDASGTIDKDEFRALLASGGKDWRS